MEGFSDWLRAHNGHVVDSERRAGFYGLDIYNMQGSIAAVLDYLDDVDPEAARIARERFGDEAALIGSGTHTGTVAAATDWGGEMEVKRVCPSHQDSYERLCHDAGSPRFLVDLHRNPALRRRLAEQRLERFIGVIYRPETELMSHYADASLPRQFDVWVWFDETKALTPLAPAHRREGMPDTYPFGV